MKKLASLTLAAISAFSFAAAADPPTRYQVTRLTSDISGAANLDPVLQNAWGVAFTPGGSPFWVADNATGCSTLYDGAGIPQPQAAPLKVKIPLPGGKIPASACMHVNPSSPPSVTPAAPTGLVWNPTTTFLVPKTESPATFIWDTEDGTIAAWTSGLNPPDQAVLAVRIGDEINVPRLVGHRDVAVMRELGVEPLRLAEDQA